MGQPIGYAVGSRHAGGSGQGTVSLEETINALRLGDVRDLSAGAPLTDDGLGMVDDRGDVPHGQAALGAQAPEHVGEEPRLIHGLFPAR